MNVDYRAAPRVAKLFDILDAESGEDITAGRAIWYADDVKGIVREYVKDDGKYELVRDGGIPWMESSCSIVIVPKLDLPEKEMAVAKWLFAGFNGPGKEPNTEG